MSVLIGGGTGFVGRHLSKMLRDKGYQVTVVSRKQNRSSETSVVTWNDIEKNGIPSKCKAVVNLAGENILNPFKRYSDKNYRNAIYESRIGTNKLLVKAITQAEKAPDVFVTMSGVGYYPPSLTAEYTESGGNGTDWLGQLAREWEEAGNLPDSLQTRRVIIRSGVVLGKDGGMIQTLKPLLTLRTLQKIGSGQQWFPWIHITDMAGIITHGIENSDVSGVLNGVAPDTVTNEQFTRAIAKSYKLFFTFGFVPEFYMKGMFGSERAKIILEGQKVIPKRTVESGYNYLYPTISSACDELAK